MRGQEKLIKVLLREKLTLATAESVTAGYLSYLITKTPGSSQVFRGGIIAYSLRAKNKFFKIAMPKLEKSQGVSKEVAAALAERSKKLFGADIGAAVVGFAGPTAVKKSQVGTVFIAVSTRKKTTVKKLAISGSRDKVRKKASQTALTLIYDSIMSPGG